MGDDDDDEGSCAAGTAAAAAFDEAVALLRKALLLLPEQAEPAARARILCLGMQGLAGLGREELPWFDKGNDREVMFIDG